VPSAGGDGRWINAGLVVSVEESLASGKQLMKLELANGYSFLAGGAPNDVIKLLE
jgi:hypothetical protein